MAPQMMNKAVAVNGGAIGKQGGKGKRAYVTFLAGDGDYVKGVVGLVKGLRKVRSAYPLVVAVLPDVPEAHRKLLEKQGCIVREIQPVYPPENQTQFAMAYYVINYSKLRIWEFVEYSKMIYLDADIQVYENIDHLFDLPDGHFYAVMDCFCEKTWSHTKQYQIGYCQQCPNKVEWPESMGPRPALYFNAGMFVSEPSLTTCEKLLSTVRITTPTPFAEQDFLNMFFKDIYKPIPLIYNLVLAMLWRHPENVELHKVKVVHYCAAGSKPWRYTGKEANMDREDIKMLVKKWWDVYNDEALDYKGPVLVNGVDDQRNQPLLAALSEAGVVHYTTAPSAA
ncbi:Inositol 3-alpha-galactosyltransferase protein [Dioscorea alata]|uniref:Inositol 3-alpha-galactosyltransferase protein n=1 Tax=Dioscorea alata TaxID=55571 RepID=A0ACB7VPK2_DIOAL|nr:Inositol 3-alpha-galactosyltransferase protein [Dioscorea alata]